MRRGAAVEVVLRAARAGEGAVRFAIAEDGATRPAIVGRVRTGSEAVATGIQGA